MRTLVFAFCTSLALLSSPSAFADTPTAASVEILIKSSGAEAGMEAMYDQMEQMMRKTMQQQSAGKTLSEAQKKALELAPARIAAFLRVELSMDAMRPAIVQAYQETLSQAEVDGLIAFYQSPAGRAFVDKMPALMQRTMQMVQQQSMSMQPKLMALMQDIQKEAGLSPAQ